MKTWTVSLALLLCAFCRTSHANEPIRFRLSVDEFGNCKVDVRSTIEPIETATGFAGQSVTSPRLPKTKALKSKDGVVRLVHDFSAPDKFDAIFSDVLGDSRNARLDQRFKALTLTSARGDDAIVFYSCRLKPPCTLVYDLHRMAGRASLLLVLRDSETGDELALRLFSHGRKDESSAKLGGFWSEYDQQERTDTDVFDVVEFSLSNGISREFRLPVPNKRTATSYTVFLKGSSPQHSVQEISKLVVQGKLVPDLGVDFDERRGVTFAKRIVPGGLAEKGGVQIGDVVVSINGERIESAVHALQLLEGTTFGDNASVELERAGTTKKVKIEFH